MTDGVKLPVPEQIGRPLDQLYGLERFDVRTDRVGLDGEFVTVGSFTDTQPLELVLNPARSGVRLPTFFDDYYNRVYFLPPQLNFGAVSSTVERDVVVWNANLAEVILTGVTMTNAEGIAISDGPGPPYTFEPLGLATYSILAGTSGPASINAVITYTFDTEVFDLELYGTRAKVSPLVPNWRKSYTVDYAFKTEILTSRSGKEQRRALRYRPRKKITFEATPTFDQFRVANRLLASWHNNTIILPELPRQAHLAVAMAAGGSIATLTEDAPYWLVAGSTVVFSHANYYETRTVDQVAGSQVTFTGSSGTAWPVGTKLHSGVAGRLAASIKSKRQTNAVAETTVEMDVTPGTEPEIALAAAPETFNGRELFMTKPNWISEPDITYESMREEVDYDRGRIGVFTPVDFTARTTKWTFLGKNFAEADALRQFFERQKGQRGEFYTPSWEPDIQIGPISPAGTRSLRIYGTDFADGYAGSTVHKAVVVFMRDGSTILRVVEDIFSVDDADGQDSVIQTGENFPVEVSPATVRMISWLLVNRHATDTLTMEWVTNAVAQCQFTFRTLEDLA